MTEKMLTRTTAKSDEICELQKLLFSEAFLNRLSELVSKKVNDKFSDIIETINTKFEDLQSKFLY